jgi:L,D-transpeptidase ErfK/SrfK
MADEGLNCSATMGGVIHPRSIIEGVCPVRDDLPSRFGRRAFLGGTGAALGLAALPAAAQEMTGSTEMEETAGTQVRHNISSFRTLKWQDYFDNTRKGAILVDMSSRALHFWSEDQSIYRLYPTSVPMTEDMERRGRTEIVQKVVGPSWRPTEAMKQRNPDWPDFIPPGPDNPLGTHALYLSWQYYRIHGTHDTRKIGRRSSNGCVGLYNEHIAELFDLTTVGTQVRLI